MSGTALQTLRLGLIGDNIAASQSPGLHRIAGRLCGIDATYQRMVPRELSMDFGAVLRHAQDTGFRGVNVTYPYKERAATLVSTLDPEARMIGSVNTILFEADGPHGYNTDFTGFKRAYRAVRGAKPPGTVCLIGAGGVGKAVAFGLAALGAEAIRIVDTDPAKASRLAEAVAHAGAGAEITAVEDGIEASIGAEGLVNCTPLGMTGIAGTPLPASAIKAALWAFDAVYTPQRTQFLEEAERAGLEILSGYELFLAQGVDAWQLFSGTPVDACALRAALAGELA